VNTFPVPDEAKDKLNSLADGRGDNGWYDRLANGIRFASLTDGKYESLMRTSDTGVKCCSGVVGDE